MSGIEVDEEIATLFNEIKLRSIHKFASFRIVDKKKVVVDVKGDPQVTETKEDDKVFFEEMRSHCQSEPRYVLYDFGFTLRDGRKHKKIAFIFW